MDYDRKSDQQRAERLRLVIANLLPLKRFSIAHAKRSCPESAPGYVTQTLTQLVREGAIVVAESDDGAVYDWQTRRFDSAQWIERQIHGDQVTRTPADQRPRERLLRDGPHALSNADLLAILIRVGVRGESAVAGASKVANRFSADMSRLRHCTAIEIKDISAAVTKASYSQIMAGIELGRRIARTESQHPTPPTTITSTAAAIEYCMNEFSFLAEDGLREELHIVTLDTKHKPIRTHQISVGTLDSSLVHPREVFRPAVRDAAAAILVVHNHPSGDPSPSREDRQVTDRLTDAGKLLGITLLDHIIVARQACVSMREHD